MALRSRLGPAKEVPFPPYHTLHTKDGGGGFAMDGNGEGPTNEISQREKARLKEMQRLKRQKMLICFCVSVISLGHLLTGEFVEILGEVEVATKLLEDNVGSLLEVKQSAEGTQEVPGLSEVPVHKTDEVWELLKSGSRARSVGSTNANELSSRSHWSETKPDDPSKRVE
ncbi:Kinesin-like protein KIFC3 [Artemisia annua]|uniref:Kinesin-like protein KIFC3 n=1 Tax=Artemisia annua TaxID=35608 RepID=A0A2U1MQ48_ARTAN|nr:Kinesin-like protein KIFC3 [Artemisia annua]